MDLRICLSYKSQHVDAFFSVFLFCFHFSDCCCYFGKHAHTKKRHWKVGVKTFVLSFNRLVWYRYCIVGLYGRNHWKPNIGRRCFGNYIGRCLCCVQSKCWKSIVFCSIITSKRFVHTQVMFRKVIGDPPVPMIAFAFTIIGLINLTLCWPIPLGLYLSGTEVMPMESLFWIDLLIACILMLSESQSIKIHNK